MSSLVWFMQDYQGKNMYSLFVNFDYIWEMILKVLFKFCVVYVYIYE